MSTTLPDFAHRPGPTACGRPTRCAAPNREPDTQQESDTESQEMMTVEQFVQWQHPDAALTEEQIQELEGVVEAAYRENIIKKLAVSRAALKAAAAAMRAAPSSPEVEAALATVEAALGGATEAKAKKKHKRARTPAVAPSPPSALHVED